jgi:ubiquinone/menaquinone biosynthesis C-methylase UbiE
MGAPSTVRTAPQTHGYKLAWMEPFEAEAVRAAYDAVADDYAEAFAGDLLELHLDRRVLDIFVKRVAAREPVLDLGCGPSQVGQYLAERGLLVVGMDLAQRMLQVARQRTGNARMVCGDMRWIPFGSESFSGVVAYYSVHNMPRTGLGIALAEIHRILKSSGVFVVATHLGEGEVYNQEFLGHSIETVGGNLYGDDELLAEVASHSFVVDEVHYRDPLSHEHNTRRIYLICRRAD